MAWIKIPDPWDLDAEPWVGHISIDENHSERWNFEIIRGENDISGLYKPMDEFNRMEAIAGLLDFHTDCVLINPIVTSLQPGSLGVYARVPTVTLKGQFRALLRKAGIANLRDPSISRISFSSASITAWFGRRKFKDDKDWVATLEHEDFSIDSVGRFQSHATRLRRGGVWEESERHLSGVSLEFCNAQSLSNTMEWCFELEALFQFLTGLSTRWPVFNLTRPEKYQLGDDEYPYVAELEFGRTPWKDGETPHPLECAFNDGRGAISFEEVIRLYLGDRLGISERIQIIRNSRYFSNSLNDRFTIIIPVLEKYLEKKFKNEKEESFVALRNKFFDLVEGSEDLDILEFSRKHISVVNNKAPSLQRLLERAIVFLNESGLSISVGMARRISKRRSQIFHGGLDVKNEGEVTRFQAEVYAATAILALLTYRDLGFDLRLLERGRRGNQEISWFLLGSEAHPGEQ